MINIIGAGPAGNYAAYLLAKRGQNVTVYERGQIGKPVQCTGIVTNSIQDIIKIQKKFLVNKVKLARIFSPNGKSIDVKLRNPNLILNREKFDKHLAQKAEDAGAKIKAKQKFEGIANGKILINGKMVESDKLIGADGPTSDVAKSCGMYGKRKFVIGTQARVKLKCNPEEVEFYLGIGEFAWLVPENSKIARIGIIAKKKPNEELNYLLKLKAEKSKIIDYQAGPIPLYNSQQILCKKNIALLGDAATQVKATTYGGIIPGLIAAQELSKNFSKYPQNYNKRYGKELWTSLLIRKTMNKFKPKDYNQLIEMFRKEKVREIIEKNDRDFPTKFLIKLLLKEPRLLKFSKRFII